MAVRKQVTQWVKATRAEKSAILDAVCEVTCWRRDHARKAIRRELEDQIEATDLLALRHQISDIQANLIELGRRGTVEPRAKANAAYLSQRRMALPRGHLDMGQQDARTRRGRTGPTGDLDTLRRWTLRNGW